MIFTKTSKTKILLITFSILFTLSSPTVFAWGFRGGKVFDVKRYLDSIKETTQQSLAAKQTVKILEQMYLLNTRLGNEVGIFFSTITKTTIKPLENIKGKSTVNPNVKISSLPYHEKYSTVEAIYTEDVLQKKVNLALQNNIRDTAETINYIKKRQETRQKALKDLQTLKTIGLNDELQKASMIAILSALEEADAAKLTAATTANFIESKEKENALEELSATKNRMNEFAGYDPFNPSEYDKKNYKSESENFGFFKFKH
jgi:hypothetical protein